DGTFDPTFAYPNPGFVTIGDIPAGAACVVTESGKPAAPTIFTWGAVQIAGSPAPIVAGQTAQVGVTNPLVQQVGSLKITKTVTDAPQGFTGSFTVHVDC